MSYTKLIQTKVIRTRHEIKFHIGSTASSIVDDLKSVPIRARLIEADDENLSLIFEEEVQEKV